MVAKERVSDFWRPIVGMDLWSLIWRRRQHHQAVVAQAWHSPVACLASTTRGEATEAMTNSRIVVGTVVAQAFVVGLLDIDNKRGGNRGNRATSQGGSKFRLSLSQLQGDSGGGASRFVVGAWCRGQGQEGQTATG